MTAPRMAIPICTVTPEPDAPFGLAILGSTGSIGRQTLEIVAEHPDRFRVVSLAAGSNAQLLAEQAARFRPQMIALERPDPDVSFDLPAAVGVDGLTEAATHPDVDIVVTATSGHAAILPTARAIEAGKTIALANKETIVCAGELIVPLARKHGVEIRPVDSEHSAIWQSLGRSDGSDVERLILTASGGPFRQLTTAEMADVTPEQALAHPNWSMGGKITIDSATLMNKGLELIEAHWLFGIPYDRIDVVIHPESVIHSLVEFVDGSHVAQLGLPDMRLPIRYALTFPRHTRSSGRRLSLVETGALHFAEPDPQRFPALRLAREAGTAKQSYPTVLSAADEVAVEAFVQGRIRFTDIAAVVEHTLDKHKPISIRDFGAVEEADEWARRTAARVIDQFERRT